MMICDESALKGRTITCPRCKGMFLTHHYIPNPDLVGDVIASPDYVCRDKDCPSHRKRIPSKTKEEP